MGTLDGGAILVRALKQAGVSRIFSVSASPMGPAYRACAAEGLSVVHTRHEGAAAMMADGWARATGRPGVCMVTHGVGLTNAATGLATAWMDQSPVIALALGVPRSRYDKGNLQDIDQLSLAQPVTKWARRVPEASRLPEYLAMAARHALAGPPGPVLLELPADILAERVEEDAATLVPWSTPVAPSADAGAVEQVAALIARAQRPLLVAGSGVRWAGAGETLTTLAETAGLPTFTRRMAWTQMSLDHPLHFGIAYFALNGVLAYAAARCDLVVHVGGRLFYDMEFGRAPLLNPDAKMVQIDIDATNLGHNRPATVAIQADAGKALAQLCEAVRGQRGAGSARREWIDDLAAHRARARAELSAYYGEEGSPIHPLRAWAEIAKVLPADTIVAPGQGDWDYWAEQVLPVRRRGGYLRSGRSGCLGVEIPFGIAAKLAYPQAPVIVTAGDGGFGFSAMELDTAARYGAPVVVVVGNDAKWNMIKAQVTATYGEEADVFIDLEPRPYHKLAEALGGYGEYVDQPEQVGPAFLRALDSGKPAVLNIRVRSFASPLCRWLSQGQAHPLELIGYPDYA
ncbi:MAG: thiamine pyrophosphate-binding protein [Chloroflexota bacterium]